MENSSVSNWFETKDSSKKEESFIGKILKKKHIILISLFFILIASYLLGFFINNMPLVEGNIYEMHHDEEVVRYFLEERMKNGEKEYSVLQHIDGEDYSIRISRPNLNNPDELVRFTVYLDRETFNSLKIGDYYTGSKFEYLTHLEENNNDSSRVYPWSTIKPEESKFPGLKQY